MTITTASGIDGSVSSNTIIENVTSHSNSINGIFVTDGSTYTTIVDSLIHNNTGNGIRVTAGSNESNITNNRIYDNGLSGINITNSVGGIISNNNATYNGMYGLYFDSSSTGNDVRGNIACYNDNGKSDIRDEDGSIFVDNYCGAGRRYNGTSNAYEDCGKLTCPCREFDSAGTYTLTANMSADPQPEAVTYITSSCLAILADDVEVDCAGFSIINDGTADAAGVLVNGASGSELINVTLKNCANISGYEINLYTEYMDDSLIQNVTCSIPGPTGQRYNFHSRYSDGNVFRDNKFIEAVSTYNSYLYLSSDNQVINNTFQAGSYVSLYSDRTTFHNNSLNGPILWLRRAFNNVTNNTIAGGTYGIYLYVGADNNRVENNTIDANSYGIRLLRNVENNLFINNEVTGNSVGISLDGYEDGVGTLFLPQNTTFQLETQYTVRLLQE